MADRLERLRTELAELGRQLARPVRLMEVCGTHTVAIFRHGLRSLFPANLELISGPGCPVCVTAQRHIDAALELGARRGASLVTYGDMLRVPGALGSLEQLRAAGSPVHVVNSARAALELARQRPHENIVFLAVGFETTAPATAATLIDAERDDVQNFHVLMCHKRIVPAMRAILDAGDAPLSGFLCPGHVSVIIGSLAFRSLVEKYRRGCVVAGFEPQQVLAGVVRLLRQALAQRPALENVYGAAVRDNGNPVALELLNRVFVPADTSWRALGVIAASGYELAPRYERFDALRHYSVELGEDIDHPDCRCGEVLQGKSQPADCPLFGRACTPASPVGPCMVSGEGTCATWYKYGGGRSPAVTRQPTERG